MASNKIALFFYCNRPPGSSIKRMLFKIAVHQIVIEISSACNRRCDYCPQSLVKREITLMDEKVLDRIIKDLASIHYSRQICLNLYNEPLYFVDHLLRVIKKIKSHLPSTHIMFSTNGDMLTEEVLQRLFESGLGMLYITIHPQKSASWEAMSIEERIKKKCSELNLNIKDRSITQNTIYYNAYFRGFPVQVFSINFLKEGVDRAGSLNNIENAQEYNRLAPCYRPLRDVTISYDGSVYPCCQFFHGYEPHKRFLIGNVIEKGLFELFFSTAMLRFRKMAAREGSKPYPCKTCSE